MDENVEVSKNTLSALERNESSEIFHFLHLVGVVEGS